MNELQWEDNILFFFNHSGISLNFTSTTYLLCYLEHNCLVSGFVLFLNQEIGVIVMKVKYGNICKAKHGAFSINVTSSFSHLYLEFFWSSRGDFD